MITLLGIILLVVGLGLIIIGFVLYYGAKENETRTKPILFSKYLYSYIGFGIISFIVSILVFTTTCTVPAGHRGVVLKWGGEVEHRVMNEGLNFKIPFVESVISVDCRVQAHSFEQIDAASKEMQTVILTGKINWHFDPNKVYTIYQNIGASSDFINKVLDSALSDFLKETTPQHSINDILNSRTSIRNITMKALGDNLARYNIIIDDIYIADIQFSTEYLYAIEKQQLAERQVNTEKNLLEQIKIKAEQARTQAEGEANAAIAKATGDKQAAILNAEAYKQASILKAEGDAQAIQTLAEKQAEANKLLNESINQNLIDYNYVNKLAPNVKIIMLPNGVPMILTDELLSSAINN